MHTPPPIRITRHDDALPHPPSAQRFRSWPLPVFLALTIAILIDAALVAALLNNTLPALFWISVAIVTLVVIPAFAHAALRSLTTRNWLLRIDPESRTIAVNLRSHRRPREPERDLVAHIPAELIRSALHIRETVRATGPRNRRRRWIRETIELNIHPEHTTEIALATTDANTTPERTRRPGVRVRHAHHPTRWVGDHTLCLTFRDGNDAVIPSAARAIHQLARFTTTLEPLIIDGDDPRDMQDPEFDRYIVALVDAGSTTAAVAAISRRFSVSAAEAKAHVDELRARTAAPESPHAHRASTI